MMKLQNLRRSWSPDLENVVEEKQIPVIKCSHTLRVGGITPILTLIVDVHVSLAILRQKYMYTHTTYNHRSI